MAVESQLTSKSEMQRHYLSDTSRGTQNNGLHHDVGSLVLSLCSPVGQSFCGSNVGRNGRQRRVSELFRDS
jgi:hypothetical protein